MSCDPRVLGRVSCGALSRRPVARFVHTPTAGRGGAVSTAPFVACSSVHVPKPLALPSSLPGHPGWAGLLSQMICGWQTWDKAGTGASANRAGKGKRWK